MNTKQPRGHTSSRLRIYHTEGLSVIKIKVCFGVCKSAIVSCHFNQISKEDLVVVFVNDYTSWFLQVSYHGLLSLPFLFPLLQRSFNLCCHSHTAQ